MKDKSCELPEIVRFVLPVHAKALTLTDKDIEAIQGRALTPVDPESIWAREFYIANDQVDRHFEHFDRGHLQRFADTLVDKSLMIGHEYEGRMAEGLFYKARVGRESGVLWTLGTAYTIKTAANEHIRALVDGGVQRYGSIGFKPDWKAALCDICGRPYYYGAGGDGEWCDHYAGDEYDGEVCTVAWNWKKARPEQVEAYEYSLVYLGSQYGAGPKKGALDDELAMLDAGIVPAAARKSAIMPERKKVMLVDKELTNAEGVDIPEEDEDGAKRHLAPDDPAEPAVKDAEEPVVPKAELDEAIAERDVTLAGLDKSTAAVGELTAQVEQKSQKLADAEAELAEIRPKAALADSLLAERKGEIERKAKAAGVDGLVGDLADVSDLERMHEIEKAVSAAFDEKFPPQGKAAIPGPGGDTKVVASDVVIGGPPR